MSEVDDKIKNMSTEKLFSTPKGYKNKQKSGFFKNFILWPFRFIREIMRIGNGNTSRNYNSPNYTNNVPTVPQNNLRDDIYEFNPEKEFIRRMQADAYRRATDGRGDPPPPHHCDCDHDHDGR